MRNPRKRWAETLVSGNVEDVEAYLSAGGDPNLPLPDGVCPVLVAAKAGHAQVVKLLLRKGASPDSVHPVTGRTALHEAAITGQVTLAKLCIASGANVEAVDLSGSSPLGCAAGGSSADMIRELVAAGARMDAVDPRTGDTMMHRAATTGNVEVLDRLLRAGAELDGVNVYGQTALHAAAKNGRSELVERLIWLGADHAAVDRVGRTPLYVAAANGQEQIVMRLVASGAKASTRTMGGVCALTAAAEESHVAVVESLLKLGLPELGGRRAWADALCSSARKGLDHALAKLLPARGKGGLPGEKFLARTGTSPLHCAAAAGHIRCVRMLLEAGADASAVNRSQYTPLEIVGTLRPKGHENEALDDRIRRVLIKAFLYGSASWMFPRACGRGWRAGGSSSGGFRTNCGTRSYLSGGFAASLAAAAAAATGGSGWPLKRKPGVKFRVYQAEQRPRPACATFHKITRKQESSRCFLPFILERLWSPGAAVAMSLLEDVRRRHAQVALLFSGRHDCPNMSFEAQVRSEGKSLGDQ